MDLDLRPVHVSPGEDAAVMVMRGAVGAHVGVLYRDREGEAHRCLHLAGHFRLRDERSAELSLGALWVAPRLDALALSDVRASARLIARRNQDGRVPYAFRQDGAEFDAEGALRLGESRGLTRATFTLLVFAHAHVYLLDLAGWDTSRSPERRLEDEAAQRKLVGYLRERPESRGHADRIADEVGCTRIRSEEVAAASGMSGPPISFAQAELHGKQVLAAVQAASGAAG